MKIIQLNFSKLLIAFLLLLSVKVHGQGSYPITEEAKFSVLTCTPGPDLYSLFGHSAIRFQDVVDGHIIDWVYNYGTFQFDDSFYWKFAKGKLDYLLSKEAFPYFQQSYIEEGRGIFEQELILSSAEKQHLLDLLEENYQPENRTYRYDFFYDNCSSRIRDMLQKALDGQIDFKYEYTKDHTFREAIQSYLDYQPWSDLGIDIALGMPCDRIVGKGEMMFLPDSLMNEIKFAQKGNQPLASFSEEILPAEYELSHNTFLTPLTAFFVLLVIHLLLGFFFLSKGIRFQITDRLFFLISGLVGVMVVFLWFFTDHTATAWNLNILWANPLNLIFAFISSKKLSGWKGKYLTVYCIILILTLTCWFILPQRLHFSLISIIIGLIFTCIKILRPNFLSKSYKAQVA